MDRPDTPSFSASRSAPRGAGDGVAVAHVAGLLRRRWRWIVLPTAAVAVAAGLFVQVATPRYTGEAKVLLESRDPAFAKTASERNEMVVPIDEQAVASQVQVVMSREVAREAIKQLKLVGNPEFDPTVNEIGPVKRVLMMLGLANNPLERPPEERVLDAYYDHLLVYPVGKSRILAVEFRAKDAELAASGANTIASLYISSLVAATVDTARYASTWLGTNIETLRARVAEAEAKVEAYRAKNGLIGGVTGSASQPITTQQLNELSSQLSQARTIKADLTARVKLLKEMIKDGRAFDIPDVANNELFRRMVESRMSLKAQHALESRTLLPGHPRMKELSAQLNDLETQVKAAAERIVRTLENDSKIAGARVESLQSAVDSQREVVAKGNTSEVQLRALEREAKAQRDQLEDYLKRFREAQARDAESAAPADARIVSRAVVPELPSFPKKLPIIGIATALAFLLSSGLVLGRHLLTTPPSPSSRDREVEYDDAPQRRAFTPASDLQPEPSAPPVMSSEVRSARNDLPLPEWTGDSEALAPSREREAITRYGIEPSSDPASLTDADIPRRQAVSADYAAIEYPEPSLPAATDSYGREAETEWTRDERLPEIAVPPAKRLDDSLPQEREEAPRAGVERSDAAKLSDSYDLDQLIRRLESVPSNDGRGVLVVETTPPPAGKPGLAASLAYFLSSRDRTLSVAINGPAGHTKELGLTDLVAGEAEFLDVINSIPGSRLHAVGRGHVETDVLIEEPKGLAISLSAMAQAYDWVVCKLDAAEGSGVQALLSTVAASMDSVVIASDADVDDAGLVALYALAEEAGASQILVARDQNARRETPSSGVDLRMSA